MTVSELRDALATGATLPAEWYSDPAVLRREHEMIFQRSWQYAGYAELVAGRGDWFTCFAGTIPVVVARDGEGNLNAFLNVCRHAWTYGPDGRSVAVPRSEREADFDSDSLSLVRAQVDTWGPLVFVNPRLDAPPLEEALGPLPGDVAASGLDVQRLRFRERRQWEIAANWKVVIENYLECYHCPVAHPGFSKLIDVDPDAYRLRSDGLVSSQFGAARPAALAGDGKAPYDPRGEIKQAQYHLLWPNTTINIELGPGNFSVDVTRPDGAGRSTGLSDCFFYDDVSDEAAREIMEFATQVGLEDSALVEAVQRGLDSRMVTRGRLLLTSEHLIQGFQRLVFEALAED